MAARYSSTVAPTLAATAAAVRDRHSALIDVAVLVPATDRPAALPPDVRVVQDAGGHAHRRYGAQSECACLIRPDGYVAYRQQPVDAEALLAWLDAGRTGLLRSGVIPLGGAPDPT